MSFLLPRTELRRIVAFATVLGLLMTMATLVAPPPAPAVQATHDRLVSDNPANWTPDFLDGAVKSIVQVGDTMVVGGTFTQVQHQGGPVHSRDYIAAFDAETGAIRSGFTLRLDNDVEVIIPAERRSNRSTWEVVGRRLMGRLSDGSPGSTCRTGSESQASTLPRSTASSRTFACTRTATSSSRAPSTRWRGQDRPALASVDAETGDLTDFINHDIVDPCATAASRS